MSKQVACCAQMQHAIAESDIPMVWIAKFREIGLRVLDGGDSYIVFHFCPWCGARLPESVRNQWFDELQHRNIDPFGDAVPEDFQDERWHRK